MVADLHLDLLLELAWRRGHGETDVFARTWGPLLEAGGVRLQVCPVFIEVDRQPEGTLRTALAQVGAFHEAACEQGTCAVRGRAELDAALDGDSIGLVLALEGVEPFGYDPRTAEVFWELGLRLASLTWNRRNPFADGVAEDEDGGLSRLGRELVDRLVELGVVLDLAHASPRTFADVMEHSGEAPVLVSHAACRAVHDHPRNLADDQLHALAERGGILGMMLLPLVVGLDKPTIDGAIDHLEHAVEVMGVEHVGLGGDFTVRLATELPVEPMPADSLLPPGVGLDSALESLTGPEHYPALELALRARGWSASDAEAVMGGNVIRFLRAALPP
jgi:membrane dipeptidase